MKMSWHALWMVTSKAWQTLLTVVVLFSVQGAWADSTWVHRVEADAVPSYVKQTNSYLSGKNPQGEVINQSTTLRLKYTLQQSGNPDDIGAYFGIGGGAVLTSQLLGTPFLAYIVQGAPLVNFSRRVSLNYELQLGAAFGWKSYEAEINESNHVVGSKVTAYIGADVFLRLALARHWDLNIGFGYGHFSNANLRMPNEGLHTMGGRVSLAYYFNRDESQISRASLFTAPVPPRKKRWFADVVLFGGWKIKSLSLPNTFGVAGFSFSPTYRLNSVFGVGLSLDGIYDHSVNLITSDDDNDKTLEFYYPDTSKQLALGLQARAELTMPVFRASVGIGRYMVGGINCFYETLAMKIDFTRHFFLNIGYCLYNYNYTNNLMLGIGYRIGT